MVAIENTYVGCMQPLHPPPPQNTWPPKKDKYIQEGDMRGEKRGQQKGLEDSNNTVNVRGKKANRQSANLFEYIYLGEENRFKRNDALIY